MNGGQQAELLGTQPGREVEAAGLGGWLFGLDRCLSHECNVQEEGQGAGTRAGRGPGVRQSGFKCHLLRLPGA